VSRSEISRLLDAHIRPSVNRDAVRTGGRFVTKAGFDAHIPPAVSQVWCPGHHREWLHNMPDYDAQIPARFNRVAVKIASRLNNVAE